MLSVDKENIHWKNWSESVHCQPEKFLKPQNLEELINLVKMCNEDNRKIRVVGSGHSFTPLSATTELLVSIENLTGIDHVDAKNEIVTVWAGTILKKLGELLFEQGYAMENLGDINAQSIAGAISTGTHGTGIDFGSISTQVAGVTLLTATGELLEISEQSNPELLEAVKVSLGMLGIIVKVKLKVVPAYQLIARSYRSTLNECIAILDQLNKDNRNFEFYWFPYTETVQIKTMNIYNETIEKEYKPSFIKDVLIENGLFKVISEVSRIIPATSKMMSQVSAMGVPVGEKKGDSHLLYATPRLVKFNEMEYSIPAEYMGEVLKEIEETIKRKKYRVHFPLECRYVNRDAIWLSPAYERDSAFIAVHMYKGMEFAEYFAAIEEIFQRYDGRPHWGKMHTMTNEKLLNAYPKLNEFLRVRNELDENGIFLNEYMIELFNIKNLITSK